MFERTQTYQSDLNKPLESQYTSTRRIWRLQNSIYLYPDISLMTMYFQWLPWLSWYVQDDLNLFGQTSILKNYYWYLPSTPTIVNFDQQGTKTHISVYTGLYWHYHVEEAIWNVSDTVQKNLELQELNIANLPSPIRAGDHDFVNFQCRRSYGQLLNVSTSIPQTVSDSHHIHQIFLCHPEATHL